MEERKYVPRNYREALEIHRRLLKGRSEGMYIDRALLEPNWADGEAPGTEVMQSAQLGNYTLYAAKTTEAQHSKAPEGAARVSWSLASAKDNDVVALGGAASIEEAKDFAYLAYQAANGFIRGGDA